MNRRRKQAGAALTIATFCVFGECSAAEGAGDAPPPALPAAAEVRFYGLGGGRFEVVAPPGEDGRWLARLAEDAWDAWRVPLALPDHFPTGLTVRLAPVEGWRFPGPFWHVAGEPGGVVSVWIRSGGRADTARDRVWLMALAEGALLRQAIALGAGPERSTAPAWLAAAAAEAALIRGNPALIDAWRQASCAVRRMPSLRATFAWGGAQTASDADPRRLASFACWQWLQAEAGRSVAWRRFLAALLTGAQSGAALADAFGEALGGQAAAEVELAWQVGATAQARARGTPLLDAEESRRLLEESERLVVADAEDGAERAVKLGDLWSERADVFVAARREERLRWLNGGFAHMHPFYRNASGSLGRVFLAQRDGNAAAWAVALDDWRRDFAAGRELEAASTRLLNEAAKP